MHSCSATLIFRPFWRANVWPPACGCGGTVLYLYPFARFALIFLEISELSNKNQFRIDLDARHSFNKNTFTSGHSDTFPSHSFVTTSSFTRLSQKTTLFFFHTQWFPKADTNPIIAIINKNWVTDNTIALTMINIIRWMSNQKQVNTFDFE